MKTHETYDPYELMLIPPNKKTGMIIEEIKSNEPNLNLISDLIVLGANLDWQGEENYNYTPLHVAAWFGRVEIVRMLIDAGADVNLQDTDGWAPLHVAARFGKVEIVRMLIDAGARMDIQTNNGKLPYDLAITKKIKTILRVV